MNSKDQVLVCVGHAWRTAHDIAQETAFVHKLEYTEVHTVTVFLHLVQLKASHMVEEHDSGGPKHVSVWRLTTAGQKQQEQLLTGNPRVALAREDFLFAGCPI